MSRISVRRGRGRFANDERRTSIVRTTVHDRWTLLGAMGLGTILMYLFDPQAGTGRRAWVRDKVRRAARLAGEGTVTTWRDARNRARGILSKTSSLFDPRWVNDHMPRRTGSP
jgi:hypothetical protein